MKNKLIIGANGEEINEVQDVRIKYYKGNRRSVETGDSYNIVPGEKPQRTIKKPMRKKDMEKYLKNPKRDRKVVE